jgi:hypothetical protein
MIATEMLILFSLVLLVGRSQATLANFTELCEVIRQQYILEGHYNNTPDFDNLRCGAVYSENTPPAVRISTNLTFCMTQNSGYQASRALSEWAHPLFMFLVPALAFVLVINRPRRLPIFREMLVTDPSSTWTDYIKKKIVFCGGVILAGLSAILDATLWSITVFVLAGPLIASSAYEMAFDHYVLRKIHRRALNDQSDPLSNSYALVVLLIGSFRQKNKLAEAVEKAIEQDDAPSKLSQLVQLIPTFGDTIFGPAVFFLGTFLFTLFDARENKGDNDLAHGTAFGIWYGVIVLAATMCTATLGVARSESVEPIFPPLKNDEDRSPMKAHSTGPSRWLTVQRKYKKLEDNDTYTSEWIWIRHRRFAEWTSLVEERCGSLTSLYPGERHLNSLKLRLFACSTSCALIGVPCGLAASICYYTPTVRRARD